MKYPLQDILKVRTLRENLALNFVMEKKREQKLAAERVVLKEKALMDFKIERGQKEQKLYEDVREKCLPFLELDHFYLSLQWLHTCEIAYNKELNDARQALAEADERLLQARLKYNNVVKKKEKLVEHSRVWKKSQQKIISRKADDAVEDFQISKAGILR